MRTEDRQPNLTVGQCATLACLIEATAPKPGNVHRGADFDDVTYPDFVLSGIAIGPIMDMAREHTLGRTVLNAVRATRQLVGTNTNLGMVLLIAPLATVPEGTSLADAIGTVLAGLTAQDCADVYEAIRLAQPGGLGEMPQADVREPAPQDLIAAMRLAAGRDMVARQYAEGFRDVLETVVPWLSEAIAQGWTISQSVVHVHLRLMQAFPDSLIARKCGPETARQSALRAAAVLQAGGPGDEEYERGLADLDFWLRSDGHRRNPGTTADLIAAGLFAALRTGIIRAPLQLS